LEESVSLIDDDTTKEACLDVDGKRLFNFKKIDGKLIVQEEVGTVNAL
jgi:hypothetical protein